MCIKVVSCAGMAGAASASPLGESELRTHPEILQHLDTDLLYGFDLCITEFTLENFMRRVPPPATWREKVKGDKTDTRHMRTLLRLYTESCDGRNTRTEDGLFTKLRVLGNSALKGWRMAALIAPNETDEENDRRRNCVVKQAATDVEGSFFGDTNLLYNWEARLEKDFHEYILDSPLLAWEYKQRVQSYSIGTRDKVVVMKDDKFVVEEHDDKKHGAWEFKTKNISGLVDSGLMQQFYAEWEKCDLEKHMGPCFSASANAELALSLSFEDAVAVTPVNPWAWMRDWLAGRVDGFEWGALSKDQSKALYLDKHRADEYLPVAL